MTKLISERAQRAFASLKNAKDDYDNGKGSSDLPKVFHQVAQALPVAQGSLQSVYRYFRSPPADFNAEQENFDEKKNAAINVQSCAQNLANVFQDVIGADDGARESEYQKQAGDNKQVEVLMKGVLEATLVLAKPPAVTNEQLEALQSTLSDISKIETKPMGNKGGGIYNYGSGPQSIHQGNGPQNINSGSGQQYNGEIKSLTYGKK